MVRVVSRRQQVMRVFLVFGLVIPVVGYLAIVLLLPTRALEIWPTVASLVDSIRVWSQGLLPAWDFFATARRTSFPQVAMIASSWAVITIPVVALCVVTASIVGWRAQVSHSDSLSTGKILLLVFAMPILAVVGVWVMYAHELTSESSRAAGLGRFRYAIIGLGVYLFAGVGIGMWPANVFNLLRRIFVGRTHGGRVS